MKLLFTKVFTARSTRRPDDLPSNPVVVEVFESAGELWIKALRLAPMFGVSTYAIRNALRMRPDLQESHRNQLANLEGESGGPVRMLTLDGARQLADGFPKRRQFAVKRFLDQAQKHDRG